MGSCLQPRIHVVIELLFSFPTIKIGIFCCICACSNRSISTSGKCHATGFCRSDTHKQVPIRCIGARSCPFVISLYSLFVVLKLMRVILSAISLNRICLEPHILKNAILIEPISDRLSPPFCANYNFKFPLGNVLRCAFLLLVCFASSVLFFSVTAMPPRPVPPTCTRHQGHAMPFGACVPSQGEVRCSGISHRPRCAVLRLRQHLVVSPRQCMR